MKIDAIVLHQAREPLTVERVDLDDPKPGEAQVRMTASASATAVSARLTAPGATCRCRWCWATRAPEWSPASVLCEAGELPFPFGSDGIDELITHRYTPDEANEAFRALAAGENARALIMF